MSEIRLCIDFVYGLVQFLKGHSILLISTTVPLIEAYNYLTESLHFQIEVWSWKEVGV